MRQLQRRFVTAVAVALVAGALVTPGPSADALPPGTVANGSLAISPTSGVALATGAPVSSFILSAPSSEALSCPTAADGALGQTFIVSSNVDPATLAYDSSGPISVGQPDGAFVHPLTNAAGVSVVGIGPADGTGQLDPLPALSLDALVASGVPFPSGRYFVGVACSLAGDTVAFWSTTLDITNTGGDVTWVQGTVPDAPTITTTTVTTNSIVVAFNQVTSDPPVDTYTATATPNGGGAPISAAGGSSPLTVAGLADGSAYTVNVTATNAAGTSTSNVVYLSTVQVDFSVTSIVAGPGANPGDAVVTWRTPPALTSPSGYVLSITPTNSSDPDVPGSPFTLGADVRSLTVADFPGGVCADQYTFTVTPVFPSPLSGVTKTVAAYPGSCPTRPAPIIPPAPIPADPGPGGGVTAPGGIGQTATVQRPIGALVLTQRCGVNSAFPAEAGTDAFPGFPAVEALAASSGRVGTAPTLDAAGATPDDAPGQFDNYPDPDTPAYPTYCGVDLGTATFITNGDQLEGQYFAASGVIDQVTVLDSRDIDHGWVARGAVSDFSAGPALQSNFDGNFLGWRPVLTSMSDPLTDGPGVVYQQVVAAGSEVLPGSGVNDDSGLGSATGKVLAQSISPSPGLGGLGIAVIDARLKLLIPVINDSGRYSATVALTVV